jgi:hypothetical protein
LRDILRCSQIFQCFVEMVLVNSRRGDVAQAHTCFCSLDASVSIRRVNGERSEIRLTVERRDPVSFPCTRAASTARLRYSMDGRRIPRASTNSAVERRSSTSLAYVVVDRCSSPIESAPKLVSLLVEQRSRSCIFARDFWARKSQFRPTTAVC